jgi:hypothetical protein
VTPRAQAATTARAVSRKRTRVALLGTGGV